MTIKIPIFKSCLLAASLAQLGSLSAETKLDFDTLTMPKGSKCTEVPFAGQKYLQDKKPAIKINFDLSRNFLFFPKDGQQPSTIEAGWCSGAHNIDDPEITKWYVNMFKENFIDKTTWPKEFESALTIIASDPVGRVLLYRLIIECTRINKEGNYCDFKGYDKFDDNLHEDRDMCRRITIDIVEPKPGSSFSSYYSKIKFAPQTKGIFSLNHKDSFVSTDKISRTGDISLFHEMLHWFHSLQDPLRYATYGNTEADVFKYPLRCYYGDVAELVIWGGNVDAEEIATILGTPDYNNTTLLDYIPYNAFLPIDKNGNEINLGSKGYLPKSVCILWGDDLSENAYRLSKSQNGQEKFYMRFGHVNEAIDTYEEDWLPNRYHLANELAKNCYKEITGKNAKNWDLKLGQAIKQ